MTFEDRVAAQRAIEEVYWRHRLWPQENGRPKPALDEVMPEPAIRAKVEDYLRKSKVLEQYWQRPVTGEQLQAEIERMARHTKQPAVLRELWAALGNDPFVIAECLVRPLLVERLSREWYASDERFHGELKRRAESELNTLGAAGQMRRTSGEYREVDWIRDETGAAARPRGLETNGELRMSDAEWQEETGKLVARFGPTRAMAGLPRGQWSRLAEDEERFYAVAVMEKDARRIKVASVVWKKAPFDEWWNGARVGMRWDVSVPDSKYQLPEIEAVPSPSDGDSWTATSNTGAPSARNAHTVVWTGNEMIVWCGFDGVSVFNTGGRYNPATDTWIATSTTSAPQARSAASGVWTGTEMIVWGGFDRGALDSGGRYNPVTNAWRPTTSTGVPSRRASHTAVWTGNEMIIWGGEENLFAEINTGGRYNPVNDAWTPTSLNNAPLRRVRHSVVWTGNEMIVWGGFISASPTTHNTGGRYNPTTDTWTATNTTGAPESRFVHTAVWTGSEMIVWGGFNGTELDTGGRYNPTADMWTTTSTTGTPSARMNHSAVWTGNEMIVWGGRARSIDTNTGGRYNPAANAWVATATASAPNPRGNHSVIWTGSTMIVWGGLAGSTRFNTGGRYTFTMTQGSLASVSAASFLGAEMAADSIVAAFGQNLATATESAATLPLPTTLAGTNVRLRDSAGVERLAPLFFVSPGQINYLIPQGAANGNATVNVTRGETLVATGAVRLAPVAPGLFAANANGQGIAAAVALRIKSDGSQSFEPVARFDPTQNRFVAVPIDLGPETDQVFLILFGTGYRARSSLAAVTCQIGGTAAEVLFAGAAPGLAGLDQTNVRLPRALAGRGEVEVALTVDGRTANRVRVAFAGGATSCNYSISPTSQSFNANAGTGSVNVTAPNGCAWTAAGNASWITITSGSSGSGNGTVNYSVAQNTSAAQRTGTMTIAGQTFTVTQAGSTEPGQTAELKVDDGSAEGGLLSDGRMMVNRLTPPSYP
ncbi:MAG: Kelch repeat-containing protein, partial [Blastocatellia bacterium]